MKAALIICLLIVLPTLLEACIVAVNCNGVTAATCTAPCYQCGTCNTRCCQNAVVTFGRSDDDQSEDRTLRLPCPTGGRSDQSSVRVTIDPGKSNYLETFKCENPFTWDIILLQ